MKLAFAPRPVLPPIVVDLGPQVTRAELQYVLDACNEVVADGVCLPKGDASLEEPRAIAIAKRTASVIEIEVQLMDSQQPPLLRTLRFTREDPARERWRSVGLAIATLVGEGQRAEEEAVQAAREAEAPASATEPAQAPPEPSPAPPVVAAAPSPAPPVVAESPPQAARDQDEVIAQHGVFLGVGAFGGSALDDGSGRLGASLRGGWLSRSGILLLGSASYSLRAGSDDALDVTWLAFEAGVGYSVSLSNQLSLGLSVQAGVEQLRFEASAGGVESSTSVLNPVLTLGVDGGWQPWDAFGFWVALDAHSIGRKSELFVADTLVASTLPVQVTGLLGIRWRFQ